MACPASSTGLGTKAIGNNRFTPLCPATPEHAADGVEVAGLLVELPVTLRLAEIGWLRIRRLQIQNDCF
jgi:hypothetical protein